MKQFLIIVVVVVFTFGLTNLLRANAGDLDPLFDLDGKVTTDISGNDTALTMALQPDGKIVAAGPSSGGDFTLVRYNPNGSLDPLFGGTGVVVTDFAGESDRIEDICLQTDGKIVAVGQANTSGFGDIALARYNPNGTLDPTFGSGGKVIADIDQNHDRAIAVAIYSDGKIVLTGLGNTVGSIVVRYNPNGSLDPTFGTGGIVSNNGSISDVLIQPDDKIITVGGVLDFLVCRYNPNGTLDPTFGVGGTVTTSIAAGNTSEPALAVVLQPDGKIIAAGYAFLTDTDFVLVRYNPNGSLDPTFGNGGIVTTNFGATDFAFGVMAQPNGKIVAVGNSSSPPTGFALARYNPNGSLDPTFGVGGKVTTDFGGPSDTADAVAIQPDGKIVLAGYGGSSLDFALARYEGDTLIASCTLFTDDFEDGILATDWTYVKPSWSEAGGNLIGTPSSKKAEVIATPATAGCGTGTCSVQTTMQTAGGSLNKVWFFGWFQDKNNTIEVLMQEEKDKWILRQRAGGVIVAKVKAPRTILPDVAYDVKVTFDGNTFTLFVDGFNLVSMNAGAVPSGTIGYRVKKTTGTFGSVCIN